MCCNIDAEAFCFKRPRLSKKVPISADGAFKSSNIHAAVKGGANYSTLSGAFVNADQKASQFPLRGNHNMPTGGP